MLSDGEQLVELEFDRMVAAEYMLRPRLKNVVVVVLHNNGGALRFNELGRKVVAFTGRYMSDSRLHAALNQLAKEGRVRKDQEERNQPWRLTPEGVRRAENLKSLVRAMVNDGSGDESKSNRNS